MSFTIDGYIVNIANRIVYTGQFSASADKDSNGVTVTDSEGNPVYSGAQLELFNLLSQANASRASFFVNAIDTQSKGIDFVITHKASLGAYSRLKSDLSATFSKTEQVGWY